MNAEHSFDRVAGPSLSSLVGFVLLETPDRIRPNKFDVNSILLLKKKSSVVEG